jgi:hypothetical protein
MVLVERYESEIAQVLGVVDLTRVVVDYLVGILAQFHNNRCKGSSNARQEAKTRFITFRGLSLLMMPQERKCKRRGSLCIIIAEALA